MTDYRATYSVELPDDAADVRWAQALVMAAALNTGHGLHDTVGTVNQDPGILWPTTCPSCMRTVAMWGVRVAVHDITPGVECPGLPIENHITPAHLASIADPSPDDCVGRCPVCGGDGMPVTAGKVGPHKAWTVRHGRNWVNDLLCPGVGSTPEGDR